MSQSCPDPMKPDESCLPGANPHIVFLGSCKVGNFVVSTPSLKGMKARFPDAVIGFIGSDVTADLERAHPCVDWRLSWDSSDGNSLLEFSKSLAKLVNLHGPVALAINLDGFNPVTQVLTSFLNPKSVLGMSLDAKRRFLQPMGPDFVQRLLLDPQWDSPDFLSRHFGCLRTQYIAELFAAISGVLDFYDPSAISLPSISPPFDVPEVLIHCTTARSAKIWPFYLWKEVVDSITSRGLHVGLVGSAPKIQNDLYNSDNGEQWLLSVTELIDLRGQTSLLELAGACSEARAVISVDAGPLHIAAAMGTPTLAIVGNDFSGVGASPTRLWMPRCDNVVRTNSSFTCHVCSDNRFKNDACLVEGHPCMAGVDSRQVVDWLDSLFNS